MAGNADAGQVRQRAARVRPQLVGEQPIDQAATELARRQGDAVQHDQADAVRVRAASQLGEGSRRAPFSQ